MLSSSDSASLYEMENSNRTQSDATATRRDPDKDRSVMDGVWHSTSADIAVSEKLTKELVVDPPDQLKSFSNPAFTPDQPDSFADVAETKSKAVYISYSSETENKTPRRRLTQAVVIMGGCFNVFLGLGFPFSLGALFVDWLEAFNRTRAETAVIQSTCTGLTFLGGVVHGFLIRRFGLRVVMVCGSLVSAAGLFASWFATSYLFLLISIGLVMGVGCGMLFLSNNVNVTLSFSDRRAKAFALSLLTTSGGVGTMCFPTILNTLKQAFGWRGALLLMGGIYLNVTVSALLVTSSHSSPSTIQAPGTSSKENVKWGRICKPLYFAYLGCATVGFGTITGTVLTAVDYSLSKGLGVQQGIINLLIINGTSTLGRLLTGFILLLPRVSSTHIFASSFLISGAALILVSYSESSLLASLSFALYGTAAGCFVSTYSIGILHVVGEELYAVAMGLAGAVSGISNTSFGIIMGALYDVTGSYDLAFRIFGSMSVCAFALPVLATCLQSICNKKSAKVSGT